MNRPIFFNNIAQAILCTIQQAVFEKSNLYFFDQVVQFWSFWRLPPALALPDTYHEKVADRNVRLNLALKRSIE